MSIPAFPPEKAAVRKMTDRIVPFVFPLWIISYLDHADIGYAALQMDAEPTLTSGLFGFVPGLLLIGHSLSGMTRSIR